MRFGGRLEQRDADAADVFGARTERRHLDRTHGEPVVEIEPEVPRMGVREEIAVGRRDDANVDLPRLACADRPELARLERAEKQRLERRAAASPISSRNSVPPSASSKRPRLGLLRAGERALHVAEELARHELGGERAAVDARRSGRARDGRSRRGSRAAMSSLPVPVSP